MHAHTHICLPAHSSHTYLKNAEEREEAGTPDILGSLRAGLALQLKHALGSGLIAAAEENVVARVLKGLEVCRCSCCCARIFQAVWRAHLFHIRLTAVSFRRSMTRALKAVISVYSSGSVGRSLVFPRLRSPWND